MDIPLLVQWIVPFIAPYLAKLGEAAFAEVGKQAVGNAAAPLWEKLRPKVIAKEAAREATEDVIAAPDNADALGALHLQITKLLEADATLAAEIAKLAPQEATSGSVTVTQTAGDNSTQVGVTHGDVTIQR